MNHLFNQLYIIATVCLLICRTPVIRKVKWYLFEGQNTIARKWFVKDNTAWFMIRMKPFDCPLCLTFWVSVVVNCYSLQWTEAIGIASINALIASELERYLNK